MEKPLGQASGSNEAMSVLFISGTPHEASITRYLDEGETLKLFKDEHLGKACRCDDDFYLFYIVSGSIAPRFIHEDGRACELMVREKGGLLIADAQPNLYPGSASLRFVALENTVVVAFTKKQAIDLMQKDRDVCLDFLYYTELSLTQLAQRVDALSNPSSTLRMLQWIDKLCDANGPSSDEVYRIPCSISIEGIATILKIHRTTCQKILKGLKDAGIADRTRSYIVVYDRNKLRELAESDSPSLY